MIGRQFNVVVETLVCARDGEAMGQANQIADRITAKLPQ